MTELLNEISGLKYITTVDGAYNLINSEPEFSNIFNEMNISKNDFSTIFLNWKQSLEQDQSSQLSEEGGLPIETESDNNNTTIDSTNYNKSNHSTNEVCSLS